MFKWNQKLIIIFISNSTLNYKKYDYLKLKNEVNHLADKSLKVIAYLPTAFLLFF